MKCVGSTGTYWACVKCAGRTLVRCPDTMFISVEKRTDMSMGLFF